MNRITEIQKRRTGYSSGFVESASGVAAGGRTGLTAVTAAVLFLLSMFIAPVAAIIPAAATSSAVIYVGIKLSTGKAKDISWLTYVLTVIFLIKFFIAV